MASSLPVHCECANFGYIVIYLLLLVYLCVSQCCPTNSLLIGSQDNALTLMAPIYIALNFRISDPISVAPRNSHSRKPNLQSNSSYQPRHESTTLPPPPPPHCFFNALLECFRRSTGRRIRNEFCSATKALIPVLMMEKPEVSVGFDR